MKDTEVLSTYNLEKKMMSSGLILIVAVSTYICLTLIKFLLHAVVAKSIGLWKVWP